MTNKTKQHKISNKSEIPAMEELKASQDHDRSQSAIQSCKATQDHNVGDRPFKANQDYKMSFASSFVYSVAPDTSLVTSFASICAFMMLFVLCQNMSRMRSTYQWFPCVRVVINGAIIVVIVVHHTRKSTLRARAGEHGVGDGTHSTQAAVLPNDGFGHEVSRVAWLRTKNETPLRVIYLGSHWSDFVVWCRTKSDLCTSCQCGWRA